MKQQPNDRLIRAIPLDEVHKHFAMNERQDLKVLVAQILNPILAKKLNARGKSVKSEVSLADGIWSSSSGSAPNQVWESQDLQSEVSFEASRGPFTMAFANEQAKQSAHYHKKHIELYYSEAAIYADYRRLDDERSQNLSLPGGGAIMFYPMVVHKVKLTGMTLVIECPAVEGDRYEQSIARK